VPNLAILSFNGGKYTPLIDNRSNIAKYPSGCRILQNMIPRIYGPVERRPGFLYVADVDDSSVKSRMVSFNFSSTISYKLEFSALKLNVYFEQTLIEADIATPYLEADLFQLQSKQSADVAWIVHSTYASRKLSRTNPTTFSLDTITFDKGPFIKRNDLVNDDDVTIGVTGTTIATATAGAAGAGTFTITNATDTSALFPVNQRFYVTGSTGNDAAYTVASASFSSPTLTITANEAVADGTADGEIMVDGGTVTLTASSAVFNIDGDHDDALFKLTHKRLQKSIVGSATGTEIIGNAIDAKGLWTLTSKGNWGGEFDIQRRADTTNWEIFRTFSSRLENGAGDFNAQKSHEELDDGVQYRIAARVTGGTLSVVFEVDESTQDSIFRISATGSTVSVTATAVIAAPDNVVTKRWAEGSWSSVRGYPSAITFFEERAVYAFTNLDQQGIWPSETGEFEDFEAGTNAADSFALNLPTADKGEWLGSLKVLAAGTRGGEWVLSTPIDEPLKPTNFKMVEHTARGSADIQATEVNEAILFIDRFARKVREFTFSDEKQKHVSPDLTALAEDITLGGITSVAVQKNPDSIVWFTIANSPYLLSMTYEREQDVIAWSQHPLGGGGIAESVIVTAGDTEDVVTITAKFTIDGVTKRYIMDMQPRDWGSTTSAADSFFVDAGIVDTSGTTTITGLDHLEGETVAVLIDGAVHPTRVVESGQITIDETGSRVVVGLPYEYQVSPMRADIVTQRGTTLGSTEAIPEIVLSLFASGNVNYGDGTTQRPIDFRTDENYNGPPDLFTGITEGLAFDGGFTMEKNVVISGSDPLPCTVRAIILRTDQTGR